MQVADPIQQAGSSLMTLPRSVTPDEGNSAYEGYYYIKTDEFKCTCRVKPWRYLHYEDKVIVWPEKDDDSLLKNAQKMKEQGFNPKITEYNVMLGKAIPWDDIPNGKDIA